MSVKGSKRGLSSKKEYKESNRVAKDITSRYKAARQVKETEKKRNGNQSPRKSQRREKGGTGESKKGEERPTVRAKLPTSVLVQWRDKKEKQKGKTKETGTKEIEHQIHLCWAQDAIIRSMWAFFPILSHGRPSLLMHP